MSFSTLLALAVTTLIHAQNDRFAYVITDLTKEGSSWNALRRLDLQTGEYSPVLLNGTEQHAVAYDAVTQKPIVLKEEVQYRNLLQSPFGTGVAAAAYDKKNNRLYFTPMFIDQLRYIDLKTMKLYCVTDQPFTGLGNMHNKEGKVITRMVIAPNGVGYAISNDGKTFVQFSTGKKITIQSLGSLTDDAANDTISIHNRHYGFGGDMIADDAGNLYIITARNKVFKVNVASKVARYLGQIEGLPDHFTVNGAVVNAEGALLVSSAVADNAYYLVDTKSWKASPFSLTVGVYRSSDLANSNFLASNKVTTIPTLADSRTLPKPVVQVYPNPTTSNQFSLNFNSVPFGDYTLAVTDVLGRNVLQRRVTIEVENQTQTVNLKPTSSKGTYLVRLVSRNDQTVFEQKVLVQ